MKLKLKICFLIIALICSSCTYTPTWKTTISKEQPRNIALLLPLHGKFATSGRAIRDGFLTAYYYNKQQSQVDPNIQILDTSKADVVTLYHQAVQNGAQFIIGPLTKQNVAKLRSLRKFKVPVVALNTINSYQKQGASDLIQFGLFPEDEALQIAHRAAQSNPGRALIIAPQGSWGKNMLNVLSSAWKHLGGEVGTIITYNSDNLAQQIPAALNVNISKANAINLQKTLAQKFKFLPRPRSDINVILLVAFAQDARQIKPLLDFYFAGNIPVYATSHIYTGTNAPDLNQDLNEIMFCDMPWVLEQPQNLTQNLQAIQNNIQKLWPVAYKRYTRLYALGVDSYYLTLNLGELIAHANTGIKGATGILYLDKYGHIYRQLMWAKIQNGVAKVYA